jgi:hypothetical protein
LSKYILTRHAKERMRERNISQKEVEKALRNPDINYPGKSGEINIIKQIKEDKKNVWFIVLEKIMYIAENKLMKESIAFFL